MIRDYAKLPPAWWTDKEFRAFPIKTRMAALYLMSAPGSNMFGLYYLPIQTMSLESDLSEEECHKAFDLLIKHDFCRYDAQRDYVWVIDMGLRETGQLGAKDNRIIQAQKFVKNLPPLKFMDEFRAKYNAIFRLNDDPTLINPHKRGSYPP